MRVPAADLAEIDRLARAHGVSRTKYLIERGLGRDLADTLPVGLAARVEELLRWRDAADQNFRLLGLPVEIDEEGGA